MIKEIKEIIVVEGRTDTFKLKSLFHSIQTFETHGNGVSKKMINTLKIINDKKGIICFLDPDGTGKSIRQKIINEIPNAKHAFIAKKSMQFQSKKIGIAEAEDQAIIEALNNVISFETNKNSLSWNEYLELNLNSVSKRKIITDYFKIDNYNHKQLFKILNYMQISFEELINITNKGNESEK